MRRCDASGLTLVHCCTTTIATFSLLTLGQGQSHCCVSDCQHEICAAQI